MTDAKAEAARYAVIFLSRLREGAEGYEELAAQMVELVQRQPGFAGFDSLRDLDGRGITVSYWESMEAIDAWKRQTRHLEAQRQGRERFYQAYTLYITRVERRCSFSL